MDRKLFRLVSILLLVMVPVIDSLNGWMIRNEYFSVAIPYKMLLALTMFLYCFSPQKGITILPLYLWSIAILTLCYHVCRGYVFMHNIITDISWLIKFSFFVVSFCFFKKISQEVQLDFLFKLGGWYFLVYSLNVLFGILGIGYPQYEGNIGGVGFIYAGNELSYALVVLNTIILSLLIFKDKIFLFYLFLLISITVCLLKATKTSVVSALVVPTLIMAVFWGSKSKLKFLKFNKRLTYHFSLYILFMIILTPLSIYLFLFVIGVIKRIAYWLEKVDLVTLLLSSRNIYAKEAFNFFLPDFSTTDYIFGIGVPKLNSLHAAEIDHIDFFLSYGFVGLLSVYLLLIVITYDIFTNNTGPLKRIVFLMMLFTLILSLLSGHILNSALGAIPLGMLMSMPYYSKGGSATIRGKKNENSCDF